MTKEMTLDIGDLCTNCGRDTSFGTGLFVNRIPSSADARVTLGWQTFNEDGPTVHFQVDGYLCPVCQACCDEEDCDEEHRQLGEHIREAVRYSITDLFNQ